MVVSAAAIIAGAYTRLMLSPGASALGGDTAHRAAASPQSQAAAYNNSDPSWSPDGQKLVFMSDRDHDIEIYVENLDGTNVKRLTHAPGRDAHPIFSHNGRRIAFQSPRDGKEPQVYVMNADGSEQTRLTDLPGFTGVPDWSPDDEQIIFQSNLNPTHDPWHWQIFIMNSDGSGLKQLTHDDYNDQVPKWSPDGKRILFTSETGQGPDIFTYDLQTRQLKRLTTNAPGQGAPFWSPDGKTIAFTVRRGDSSDVYLMDADGSNQRKAFAPNQNRPKSAGDRRRN